MKATEQEENNWVYLVISNRCEVIIASFNQEETLEEFKKLVHMAKTLETNYETLEYGYILLSEYANKDFDNVYKNFTWEEIYK